MAGLDRLIYVDDSGAFNTGWICYGWVEVMPAQWTDALKQWLDVRKRLWVRFGVPMSRELHATQFINGRTNLSVAVPPQFVNDRGVELKKDLGQAVGLECVRALGRLELVRCGVAWTRLPRRTDGATYQQAKYALYDRLLAHWESELRRDDRLAWVVMDGDDPRYLEAHRRLRLDTRRIIEDPAFHDSRTSQWTQMADLVAWTAYQGLLRHSGKEFVHHWYDDHLRGRDVNGGPLELPPENS